ncbi:MAG: TIGR04086 family membrane protein [Christensenellales bacterium]
MRRSKTISAPREHKDRSFLLAIIKGSLIALCISLVGILIFAFILKFASISDGAIRPINQIIKGISVLVGVFVAMRKVDKMGLVGGLLIGLIYTIIAFVVFSILDGNFQFNLTLLNDILFGSIMGAICGIIAVNVKRR